MEYRTLRDGTKISTLGIGVGNYGYEQVEKEEIEKIFKTAFEVGINFFDTCMSVAYPSEVIAKMIRNNRKNLVMQNHLCIDYSSGEYKHLTDLEEIKIAFENELKKYGTTYSDIGTIHFIDEESDLERLITTGVIDYAFELKKAGIIRNVAFSSHTPSVALKTLEKYDFDVLFFGVNAGYDYEPSENGLKISEERNRLYNLCKERSTSIIVMKVYNNGQLLDKRFSPFGKALSIHQCLQYALDRPAVVSCLVGAINEEEMRKSLSFYQSTSEERDYHFIDRLTKEDLPQDCTYCGHCMPCPQQIEIPSVNRYYDLAKVGDALAFKHYEQLSVHADACISCQQCASQCPFHVDMPSKMKIIHSFFSEQKTHN